MIGLETLHLDFSGCEPVGNDARQLGNDARPLVFGRCQLGSSLDQQLHGPCSTFRTQAAHMELKEGS